MTGRLSDRERILHILEAIQEVEKYLEGILLTEFLQNSEKRFATIKQIEIIGKQVLEFLKKRKISIPKFHGGLLRDSEIFQSTNTLA